MNIYVRRQNGWIIIEDDAGNWMRYLYYSKRESIRRFKNQFGYRYKRNIKIIDYTKEKENG